MKPLFIALHELRIYLRDKADLAFSLILPIAIFALMYGAFGAQATFHGTAHVVNNDGGKHSQEFIRRLNKVDYLEVEKLTGSEANKKLERSDILMVVFIPADFSKKIDNDDHVRLVFKQRGNGGDTGQIVAGIARSVAEEMNQEFQIESRVKAVVANSDISPARIDSTIRRSLKDERANPIVRVAQVDLGGNPDPVGHFLPGIITMFVLFAITLNARALVEERKRGTLERLLTTSMSVGQLFIGKFLAGTVRGFLQALILLALGYAVFQLFTPFSFLETLVIALVFAAAAGAIGLLIGSISRTEDQTSWMAVVFTMAMTMLGGTFFEPPKDSALETLSFFSMNTYANDAFKAIIIRDETLADVVPELAVLAAIAVIALLLGRLLFKAVPGGK